MQHNMAHTKDRYLHTNCLATLANVSSKYRDLNTYTCQKLIGFFSGLTRRHHKIRDKIRLATLKSNDEPEIAHLRVDLEAIEEMIRMFLEIINSCFSHTIQHNAHLVHVMLCQREEFERFREMESFRHILQVNQ